MLKYVGKRLLQIIPVLIIVAILIFVLMYFVPGDPVQIMLGDYHATEEQIQATRARLGLDKPFLVQLWDYLVGLTRLDFGASYIYNINVGQELMHRFPYTLRLALYSLVFVVVVGIPLGVLCAVQAGKTVDRVLMVVTLVLNSMPAFWLGLLLIILFAVKLNWLPTSGIHGWTSWIMPTSATSVGALAGVCRQTRSSMLEVIRSDFVVTARSKGLSERKITYGHALPNALIPIITVCGTRFGAMLGGSTVIEAIYTVPGIGQYMVNAINSRDYPVVRGSILYIAFSFSIIMLVVDLVYAFVDPRIRAQYVKVKKKAESEEEKTPEAA